MPIQKIPAGQYLGYLAFFNKCAVNHVIGENELTAILRKAGRDPTGEEVREIIKSVSVDGRGITFQAFIDYVASFQELRNVGTEYREAFRIYDKRGDGRLSQEDIQYVLERLRVHVDVETLFRVADKDKNGYIDHNEFCELMTTQF